MIRAGIESPLIRDVRGLGLMLGVELSKEPLRFVSGGAHNIATILAMVLVGMAVYVVSLYLLQRGHVLEVKGLIMARFRR